MVKNITKAKHRFPLRQIRQIPKLFRRIWPIIFLTSISLILCFANYEPNTTLTGWDNLHPEFNLTINLQRSLFAVWQEYQSLGLLGGMAHAADLPRLLLIFIVQNTTSLGQENIRYLFTFAPLVIGPLGTYFFIYNKIFKNKQDAQTSQVAAFLGGLFYLLNLSTLQTFFTPFETFSWFYAALPLLLYTVTNYFENKDGKSLIILFIISFFSAPAFYVETVFIVFFLILLPFIIEIFFHYKNKTKAFLSILKVVLAFLLPHLYWLLPVIFFVLNSNHVNETAKINLVSSPETFFRNLQFGNLKSVALLQGFWFNFLDLGTNLKFDYLYSIWRNHLANPMIYTIGILSFILVLIGLYYAAKQKYPYTKSLIAIFFISFFFLIGGGLFLNTFIPLVGELFRSPFTKFSIPLSFIYSCFFATGTVFLLDIFSFLHYRFTYLFTTFTVVIFLILFMSPAFSGNLISPSMRQTIPAEYQELFNYLNTQNQSERIANFPQNTFWGWNYYDWGYRGSGFLWYGIKQPILDRAFDVWEKSSERYYEEISSTLFSGNQKEFESILDKYDIKWLLIDKHVIAPDGKTDLGLATLEDFIKNSNKFTEAKSFGDKIYLHKLINKNQTQDFISLTSPESNSNPFSSLSLRPNSDWIYKSDYVSLTASILPSAGHTLHIPSFSESENLIPVKVEYQKLSGLLSIRLTPITPTLFIDSKQIDFPAKPTIISIPTSGENFILQTNHNYYELNLPVEIPDSSNYYDLTTVYLPSQKSFPIMLYNGIEDNSYDLTGILSQSNPTPCYLDKPNRKIEKIVTPNSITLLGTDVVACLSTPLPYIPQGNLISYSFSYSSPTLTLANVNISGKDFNASEIPQPLEPKKTPQGGRAFASSTGNYQQINLILEAAETKSVQEIEYQDITVSSHSLLFSQTVDLPTIPSQDIPLSDNTSRLQISLLLTKSQFDYSETGESNSLFPESRNCDQFNEGNAVKITKPDGFLYQSKNAIECDYLNLRNLDHSLNYLLSFDYDFQKGLPLTACLENYTTKRCDVYERLIKSSSTQSLIQPVANPSEDPGYTLHLSTQSIGDKISSGLLKSLTIHPIPLHFIKSISLSNSSATLDTAPAISSTHPAEFIYTFSAATSQELALSLYQTKSPYWKAIVVSPIDLKLPPWLLTIETFIAYPFLHKLTPSDSNLWHNSWILPKGNSNIVIIYTPQYLEFFGLFCIPLSIICFFCYNFISRKSQKTLH